MKIKFGRIIEGFAILPNVNLSWITTSDNKKKYQFMIGLFFWYVTVGNLTSYLDDK